MNPVASTGGTVGRVGLLNDLEKVASPQAVGDIDIGCQPIMNLLPGGCIHLPVGHDHTNGGVV